MPYQRDSPYLQAAQNCTRTSCNQQVQASGMQLFGCSQALQVRMNDATIQIMYQWKHKNFITIHQQNLKHSSRTKGKS
jgi:hypothetical protein